MKKFMLFSLVCLFSTMMFVACEREQGVIAGREDEGAAGREGEYTPAPGTEQQRDTGMMAQDVQGELVRVDTQNKSLVVRTADGQEQTYKYDDQTTVMGMPQEEQGAAAGNKVENLQGKEGSQVTISWRQQGSDKIATMINVSRMSQPVQPGR